MANGKCRLHGGMSTGPKTAEGRARIAAATRAKWAARRCEKISNEINPRLQVSQEISISEGDTDATS